MNKFILMRLQCRSVKKERFLITISAVGKFVRVIRHTRLIYRVFKAGKALQCIATLQCEFHKIPNDGENITEVKQ